MYVHNTQIYSTYFFFFQSVVESHSGTEEEEDNDEDDAAYPKPQHFAALGGGATPAGGGPGLTATRPVLLLRTAPATTSASHWLPLAVSIHSAQEGGSAGGQRQQQQPRRCRRGPLAGQIHRPGAEVQEDLQAVWEGDDPGPPPHINCLVRNLLLRCHEVSQNHTLPPMKDISVIWGFVFKKCTDTTLFS